MAGGALVMAFAVTGALFDPDLKLGGVALFLGAVIGAHDGVLLPVVIGAGALLHPIHRLVRAALLISLCVTLVALPLVLGRGRVPDNPSVLPLPYGQGLLVVLVATWVTTLVLLVLERGLAIRQKTVRTQTIPQCPSDG
ncbi:hypothetical protein BG844_36175 [Couchioplanes caeruleus subsp. caeruleus]|uniref:Uncharacterized protein n=1 Tax=Couchioplanes caeruleus subsp. caeruleus TaxID=56427 RepID=A0A1K0GFT4_9ACTN|nr:hypothetical protein BG844_36175 [Couchioplanes caeruleus subsp. caeruleus]